MNLSLHVSASDGVVSLPQSWTYPDSPENYDGTISLPRLFESQVKANGDAIAVLFKEQRWTYAVLNDQANQLARYLQSLGLERGEFVGVYCPPGYEVVVAALGIMKAGGVYVPIDGDYPPARIGFMVADTQAPLVLTTQNYRPTLQGAIANAKTRIVCLEAAWEVLERYCAENLTLELQASDLAYINYTSGSMGTPKGVMVSHGNLSNYVQGLGRFMALTPADVYLFRWSIAFGPFQREVLMPLAWGAATAIATIEERKDPRLLLRATQRYGVTILDFMPTAWRSANYVLAQLAPEERAALLDNRVRAIGVSGESLPAATVRQWWQLSGKKVPVYNLCGGAEVTCIVVAHCVTEDDMPSPVPVGRPICHSRLYILNEQMELVPPGVSGYLYVGGPSVTQGYLNQPELTQAKFIADPFSEAPNAKLFATGDIAQFLPDGTIQHLGRGDRLVKLRGYRLELGEVEAVYDRHPAVKTCAALVREDREGDRRLVLYVVPASETPFGELQVALREYGQVELPNYGIPSHFVSLTALPLNANGKVDYFALPAPSESQATAGVDGGDEVERSLREIWQRVLGIKSVDLDDDFYALGGNSLLGLQLFVEIEKCFGYRLPLATLLQLSTLGELAATIRQQNWLSPFSSLVPLQTQGDRPPLFFLPPGGGHALTYRLLSQTLGNEQPIYALEARSIDGKLAIDGFVEDDNFFENIVNHYLRLIRQVQPTGPYFLAGLSMGGTIAWELACRLEQTGETVALVALFDTYGPDYPVTLPPLPRFFSVARWWLSDLLLHPKQSPFYLHARRLKQKFIRSQPAPSVSRPPSPPDHSGKDKVAMARGRIASSLKQKYIEKLRETADFRGGWRQWLDEAALFLLNFSSYPDFARVYARVSYFEQFDELSEAQRQGSEKHLAAWRNHQLRPYSGSVVLFRAREQPPGFYRDELLGWQSLALGQLMVCEVPGKHTTITQTPALANQLQEYLKRAQQQHSQV